MEEDHTWIHVKSKADDIEIKYTSLLNYLERRTSFHELDSVRDINLWNQYLYIEKEVRAVGTIAAVEYVEAFAKRMRSYRKRFLIRKFQRLYVFVDSEGLFPSSH
jgi:hypothetical protein